MGEGLVVLTFVLLWCHAEYQPGDYIYKNSHIVITARPLPPGQAPVFEDPSYVEHRVENVCVCVCEGACDCVRVCVRACEGV